jgi:SAM-dependent methyltransferase
LSLSANGHLPAEHAAGGDGGLTPQRTCARCTAQQEIRPDSLLWPGDWRCPQCGFGHSSRNDFVQLAPDLDDVNEGFELTSYEELRRVEDGHFWFTARNRMVGWLVRRFAPSARRALEVGCGTGYVLYALRDALPGAHLSGSELHSLGLGHARQRHGKSIEFFQMDARTSGLSNALDVVGAFDVLEHIPEDDLVLAEIHRMLRPGGVLIATVPQHRWLWSHVDEHAHHCRRYAVHELAKKAELAGFKTKYETSFGAFTLPLMALDRLRVRGVQQEAPSADVPAGLNAMLKFIFWLEELIRRAGIKLPFGGSTVLVAEKPHGIF